MADGKPVHSTAPSAGLSRAQLRRAFFADWLRTPWAALYWNFQKTQFVRAGRPRGCCPCHHASDSGRAGETECLPTRDWRDARRFARICPLLTRTADGWRCSVSDKEVRPFWGRVLLTALVLGLGLYLTGVTAVLYLARHTGRPGLHWVDVAWPGHWDRFAVAQARYFRERSIEAMRNGNYREALVSLSSARQLDPWNYLANLQLARLWGYTGDYGYSQDAFEELLRSFPQDAAETATSYHDMLLAAGWFRPLAKLSLDRSLVESNHSNAWIRTLLFAIEHGRLASEFSQINASELARTAPWVQHAVQSLALEQSGEHDAARDHWLNLPGAIASSALFRLQIESLLRLEQATAARDLLEREGWRWPGFATEALRYRVEHALAPDSVETRAAFRALLRANFSPEDFDRLCALLIETNDRASLRRIRGYSRLPDIAATPTSLTALWSVAIVLKDPETAAYIAATPDAPATDLLRKLHQNGADQRPLDQPGGARFLLNTLPLPRETIFALVARAATWQKKQAQSLSMKSSH